MLTATNTAKTEWFLTSQLGEDKRGTNFQWEAVLLDLHLPPPFYWMNLSGKKNFLFLQCLRIVKK